eukprot:TRINITY_DN4766_c0_g2_i1.p1 TRINITY_DN4766_c0_g2~~TRINITY_DN4766_c0_g2_i1.p1  ORF type:complete len:166 (+),score=24.71 TRINITY_DN4766_c0_g2_i1:449-946(+)
MSPSPPSPAPAPMGAEPQRPDDERDSLLSESAPFTDKTDPSWEKTARSPPPSTAPGGTKTRLDAMGYIDDDGLSDYGEPVEPVDVEDVENQKTPEEIEEEERLKKEQKAEERRQWLEDKIDSGLYVSHIISLLSILFLSLSLSLLSSPPSYSLFLSYIVYSLMPV